MLVDVLPYLRCPVCGQELARSGAAVRCGRGHSFDVARQGYVHLVRGGVTHAGDTAAMVAARERFLASGGYAFLDAALVAAVPAGSTGPVVDAGAGTGRHLAALLDALPGAVGLAVDVSRPALRRAARAHPRIGAVRADAWRRIPVADRVAGVLLNIFAPRNGPEFARVLHRDGMLLVATPTSAHLAELAGPLGLLRVDPDKEDRVAASLARWFHRDGEQVHHVRLELTRQQVVDLVGMGPAAHHTAPAATAEAAAGLPDPVPVTASVRLGRYRPRGHDG